MLESTTLSELDGQTCCRCKARGTESIEKATDPKARRCPRCSMVMWCKSIPRPLRFHDLRHTTATLILAHGGTLGEVQNILGHSDPTITAKVYAHLVPASSRSADNRLAIGKRPTSTSALAPQRLVSPWSVTERTPQKLKARPRQEW